MPTALTVILLLAAVLGTLALALQLLLVRRHLQEKPKTPSAWPGTSVLEPRCGVDDELEQNLCFALDYPRYEVVLGVKDARDPAWRVALEACRRWPRIALAVPVKDALLFAAWVHGLFTDTVDWRGNKLKVMPGSRLVPLWDAERDSSNVAP